MKANEKGFLSSECVSYVEYQKRDVKKKKHCRAYDSEVEKEQKGTLRMNLLNINNNLF